MFYNLRSTQKTKLAEEIPFRVVSAWTDNFQPVAAKHYLQVTEGHFRQAAGPRSAGRKKAGQPRLPADLPRAWGHLPEHVKAALLALAANGAATCGQREREVDGNSA